MCGRYTLTRQQLVVDEFEAVLGEAPASAWWRPRFNVAPTQPAPVVVLDHGVRTVEMMRWGLVPHWAGRQGAKPPLMINARKETLAAKPMFRDALARRRCLVPADGFFEWKREGGANRKAQGVYLHPRGGRLVAFAGLWARVRTDAGEQHSFAVVTGPPNELVAPIHDRMPVVLDRAAWAAWLDPALDGAGAQALLGLPPVDDWIAEPVSARVNSVANDDAACIAPVAITAPAQGDLFGR